MGFYKKVLIALMFSLTLYVGNVYKSPSKMEGLPSRTPLLIICNLIYDHQLPS